MTRKIVSANEEIAGKRGGSAMKLQIVRVSTSVKEETVYVKVKKWHKLIQYNPELNSDNLCEWECSSDGDCRDFHCNTAVGYQCKYAWEDSFII